MLGWDGVRRGSSSEFHLSLGEEGFVSVIWLECGGMPYFHQPPLPGLDPFIDTDRPPSTLPDFRVFHKYRTDEYHPRRATTAG